MRRVSLRSIELPELSVVERLRLEVYLADIDDYRAQLRKKLDALDRLDRAVSAGVADGVLRVAPAPETPSVMMSSPVSEDKDEEQ